MMGSMSPEPPVREHSTIAPQPFAHLGTRNEALYRDVLQAFTRARDRFIVHLRPEDVLLDLVGPADADAVVAALESLVGWGNLRSDPDTSRVTTVADFHRARFLYQLTPAGRAAEEAIALYEEALGRRGALQSVALADIAEQLRALCELMTATEPDPARTHLLLVGLAERFTGLADNAQAFMASLRRVIDFSDGDVAAFLAYKQRLIDYIDRFIADLANRGAEIAELIQRIESPGVDRLLSLAARREASDALPDLPDDPGHTDTTDTDTTDTSTTGDAATDLALRAWRNRWRGLHDWFVSDGSRHPSQARLLRGAALTAITQLIDTVAALNERRSGRSDRSADFRALARWFAQAPDEQAAHRLWRTAFGLTPARHLSVTAETVAAWQDSEPTPATPWRQAPPVRISPQLRRTGAYERRGQPNRVTDRAEQRRALAERAEQETARPARRAVGSSPQDR
jgi:uncharacterized protein (TIGR02677 family)